MIGVIKGSFLNFWVNNYIDIAYFLLFTSGVLYLYHGLINLLIYRAERIKGALHTVSMCISTSIYCMCFFIASYFKLSYEVKVLIIPTMYLTAFISFLSYLNVIKDYFHLESKAINIIYRIVGLTGILIVLDFINYFISGDMFLFVSSSEGQRSVIGTYMQLPYRTSPLGNGIVTFSMALTVLSSIYILYWIYKNKKKEYLLKCGLILSIALSLHDGIYSMGYFYYGIPLIYLAYSLECLRFTYYYQKQSVFRANYLQKELNRVSKVAYMGKIAGGICHDIRTPLTFLTMKLSRLKKKLSKVEMTKHYGEDIDLLKEGVSRINEITESYMGLIYEGRQRVVQKENLHRIINEAITLSVYRRKDNPIKIINEVSKNVEVSCHQADLEFAIMNLLNNASDAIKGLNNKWIKFWFDENKLYVQDAGAGIPSELQEQIFELQFTTKEKGEGTGLGLVIVKEMLKSMGITIRLDNSFENTTFVIDFDPTGTKIS